jgi:hypothetical protein
MPEIRLYGTGGTLGFPMGNAVGAIHCQRGYSGPTQWSYAQRPANVALAIGATRGDR